MSEKKICLPRKSCGKLTTIPQAIRQGRVGSHSHIQLIGYYSFIDDRRPYPDCCVCSCASVVPSQVVPPSISSLLQGLVAGARKSGRVRVSSVHANSEGGNGEV